VTYSIVARDAATGELGVAVQSHWFSVGTVVTWAEAGVGAVATQAFAQPSYGPLGLALMKSGIDASAALRALLVADSERERRQVAMIDCAGTVAAHTGDLCIESAGHLAAESVSVQANMMRNERVWPAMLQAYELATGDLAHRLMHALEAGEAAGGDLRGRQSAAMLVVSATSSNQPWRDRIVDLRVEDSSDPLGDLRRLLEVSRAYRHMESAEESQIAGDLDATLAEYRAAIPLLRGNDEAAFWVAVLLAHNGHVDKAKEMLRDAIAREPGWADLLRRLPAAGMFRSGQETIERVLGA
jgi:uncharacterized Ntn-hydrolase superfamily protein